jgi:hypothetical protein
MQSDSDAQKFASGMMGDVMGILSGKNTVLLEEFSQKGTMIVGQLKDVSVPENMLDVHIRALRLAQYATTLKDSIQSNNGDDPLSQVNSLAKIQGFIGLFSEFMNDMNVILVQYDIQVPLK